MGDGKGEGGTAPIPRELLFCRRTTFALEEAK